MIQLRHVAAAIVTVAVLAVAAGGSWAASSGSSSSSSAPAPDTPLEKADKAVDAGDYNGAIPVLESIVASDPNNADAFNLLGYSHRKLGKYDDAKVYYFKALDIDPEHKGANEYLGELYLELDDLDAAEERLEVLDDACGFFGCDEYDDLEEMIEAYRARNQQS